MLIANKSKHQAALKSANSVVPLQRMIVEGFQEKDGQYVDLQSQFKSQWNIALHCEFYQTSIQ